MKYFTYELKTIGNGEKIGPASYLPSDSETGRTDSNDILYGKAEIDSLECIADFNPVEIAKYDYPFTPEELFVEKVKDGFDTGNGYKLGLSTEDRNSFASFLTQYANKEAIGTVTTASMVALSDTEGHLHYMTLQDARVLLDAYGDYYTSLWTAYKQAIS